MRRMAAGIYDFVMRFCFGCFGAGSACITNINDVQSLCSVPGSRIQICLRRQALIIFFDTCFWNHSLIDRSARLNQGFNNGLIALPRFGADARKLNLRLKNGTSDSTRDPSRTPPSSIIHLYYPANLLSTQLQVLQLWYLIRSFICFMRGYQKFIL